MRAMLYNSVLALIFIAAMKQTKLFVPFVW